MDASAPQRATVSDRFGSRGDLLALVLDFIGVIKPASIDTGTTTSSQAPGVGVGDVGGPERPGPALDGSGGVNPTVPSAFPVRLEENAVLVTFSFDEAEAISDLVDIFPPDLVVGNVEKFGDCDDLFRRNPDVPFAGSGAATAATGTFKRQSSCVPQLHVSKGLHANSINESGRIRPTWIN